ncbi:MAG: DEAD/DEAH box helicase family protein [bacterium]|nr:DEAD/DEAH box helicase family protein [bacterium]
MTFKWDPNDSKTRTPYIADAVSKIVAGYSDGSPKVAASIPPRFGKSNIIYAVAQELRVAHQCPATIVIAPWTTLAEQLRDEKKYIDHLKHYETRGDTFATGDPNLRDPYWSEARTGASNPFTLFTTTIGKANLNTRVLLNGFKLCRERTGKRGTLVIDECHLLKGDKPWGDLYESAIAAGVYCVVMTGTPYRSDKTTLPGFAYSDVSEKSAVVSRFAFKEIVGTKIHGETVKSQNNTVCKEIMPDVSITWAGRLVRCDVQAFCDLGRLQCSYPNPAEGDPVTSLSEMGPARKNLRAMVESPTLLQKCCETTIDRWLSSEPDWQEKRPQWMVMAGSDFGNDDG